MRWLTASLEVVLGLAVVALLALLVFPWGKLPLPAMGARAQTVLAARAAEVQTQTGTVSVDAILPLFVGRKAPKPAPAVAAPEPAPAPQPAPKAPVAAPWMRYMGRSTASDGSSSVYLKDSKSGKVVRAAPGVSVGGWTLVSEDEAGLVLSFGEDLYLVSKR